MVRSRLLRRCALALSFLAASYAGGVSAATGPLTLLPGQNPFQVVFVGEQIFNELLSFELTAPAARVSSVVAPLNIPAFNIQTFLFNAQYFDASLIPLSGTDAYRFTALNVPAGVYFLGVNGATAGAGGGFAGSIDVTPVPEPANWAMLLAGLGLITAFVRRTRA